MNSIPVSVIVAIYNAEKTLPRLLDSLRAQTMHDFEVLMIDDGSTDNSGAICDRYAESDKRFKPFHKSNEGIGRTRQFGIEQAKGDYTIHADADDWVDADYLECLYKKALSSNADLVICDFIIEKQNQSIYISQEPSAFDKTSLINDLIYRLPGGPWNRLIKSSAYKNNDISYINNLNYGEDQIFNLQLLLSGISVSYLPKALYHYDFKSNLDSATRGLTLKKLENRELYVSTLRQLLPNEYDDELDNKHLDIVYLAIQSKLFSRKDFNERFSFLSRAHWRTYSNKAFIIKLIIWTSLNVSYNLALFLSAIKKIVRRIRQ